MKFWKLAVVLALVLLTLSCSLLFQQPTLLITVPGSEPLDLSFSSIEWRNVDIDPREEIQIEILNRGRDTVVVDLSVQDSEFAPGTGFYQFSVSESSVTVGSEETVSVTLRYDPTLPSYTVAATPNVAEADIIITDNDDEDFVLRMRGSAVLEHQFDFDGIGGFAQFDDPFGIAMFAGDVYVADTGNSRVQIFDESGTYDSSFGDPGSLDDQFAGLTGVAVSVVGFITTGETTNSRIQRFTPLTIHDNTVSGLGQVYGVATTRDAFADQVTYATDSSGIIRTFNEQSGAALGSFGSSGTGPGQLDSPYAIALDSDGNVYVADGGTNDKVVVFDSSGAFVNEFTWTGLDDPQGVAVLSSGDVWVTDSVNDQIVFFDRDGQYFNYVFGAALGVSTPRGIAVDEDSGTIYVVDSGNNRVRVFRLVAGERP